MTLKVIFKNFDKSEIAQSAISDRVLAVVNKFPQVNTDKSSITLEMKNSPQKSGLDMFTLTLNLSRFKSKRLLIAKSSSNMYVALAELCDSLLELLNRDGDRTRVKNISKQRSFLKKHRFNVTTE